MPGCCEHGDEHTGSIKHGTFLNYLRTQERLKNDSAPLGLILSSHLLLGYQVVFSLQDARPSISTIHGTDWTMPAVMAATWSPQ